MDNEEIKAFIEKHKKALLIGGGVILLIAFMSPEEPVPIAGYPDYPQNPGYPANGGGGGGDFDMDKWREDQARDDRRQQREVESIREVERCVDEETGEVIEVSIHVGC